MSVPVLLTVLDTNAANVAVAPTPCTMNLMPSAATDDNLKTCASYVDVAAASVAGYTNTQQQQKIDNDDVKTAALMLDSVNLLEDASIALSSSSSASSSTSTSTQLTNAVDACLPSLHNFIVQLDFELEPYEYVGLTGETQALGEWRLENCVTLKPERNSKRRIWSANVLLHCTDLRTSYRYFIYTEDVLGRKQIRHWETHLQPRSLKVHAKHELNEPQSSQDHFGVIINSAQAEEATTSSISLAQVKRGWLTTETIVQFKFIREHMFHNYDISKFDAEHVQIKIEPHLAHTTQFLGVHIDVAHLNYGQSHLKKQHQSGAIYKRGDILIFHLTVYDLNSHAYAVKFYRPDGELVGRAEITPEMLMGSEGELELKIYEPHGHLSAAIIAQLTLPYVIVRPYANAKLLDFRTTYAHYWPKSWPKLHVGHRGNGRSFIADPPAERENTLASFMRAYESHADMIELDVHLTADGVPIIYHDFGMYTAPAGRQVEKFEQLEYVLIKDLNYEQIKELRIFAIINDEIIEYPAHNAESRFEHRIFPQLEDVLVNLPKTLGIDVEIKWPQRIACGDVEAVQTIDKNFFVDRVLDTIINHGCGRPLIFSSFDADICTMLRFKQNIFPVMFLTMGETKKWSPFMDLRTRNFLQAINHAQAFELAGTAPHAEDFLGEHGPALMQKAVEVDQIAVVWGDDLNSKERVSYFNAIGATAICYDRADLFVPEHKQRAFFNSSNLIAEFEAQCPRRNVAMSS